ncbi:hypothetical protein [Rubinisphaera margarita]|uniref:hypothetical protein n=1 Tax=Rubinisphaera margarita TaxID=2909586 RepID=UPI001EE92C4C|nr:hypothetical protein [Rubinisphaera margarita]MCG6154558.1 hypothetical protein [Rubinisphaera margarita]
MNMCFALKRLAVMISQGVNPWKIGIAGLALPSDFSYHLPARTYLRAYGGFKVNKGWWRVEMAPGACRDYFPELTNVNAILMAEFAPIGLCTWANESVIVVAADGVAWNFCPEDGFAELWPICLEPQSLLNFLLRGEVEQHVVEEFVGKKAFPVSVILHR